MIRRDHFYVLTDKEKGSYNLQLCEQCCFYHDCELNNDYITRQLQKKPPSPAVIATPLQNTNKGLNPIIKVQPPLRAPCCSVAKLPFYIQEIWENEVCPMKGFYQVECGSQWVAAGIGDDFKIAIKYNYTKEQFMIDQSSDKENYETDKWEPDQPVFISAPTGWGKNTFVEQELLEYIRKLNHLNKTNHKILILSNRRALTEQAKDRLEKGITENDKVYFDYREYVDVMPYHSLLNRADDLKHMQIHGKSKYLFVICDEAHFFTSDAAFNPDTEKILETIIDIFQDTVRVYMTATPYECLEHIREKESRKDKYMLGVLYHFKRDYRYLNTRYFSNENIELKEIIKKSVIFNNENWLVFIDNKKQGATFKRLLEDNGSETAPLKGRVITVDADSKYNDKKYQEMIVNENFGKDINVVIATSVIDNGVNFRNIQNIVITDIDRTKCLQMIGRVRIEKNPVTKAPLSKVTMYIKRHHESFIAKRLKSIGVQQDAYHDYDMVAGSRNYKWEFLDKYKDNDSQDWENSNHWFRRDKKDPDRLYPNKIARSLADKCGRIYESILKEMAETDKGKKVSGQKYLEFQLSWFGKRYSKKNDITLNGYKNDGQLEFEKWIREEWLDKKISKEDQKNFGKTFFTRYNPIFGLCTKKQGFSSDDNRGENGPKAVGYSIKRIKEIFQIKKMPFSISADNDYCTISMIQDSLKDLNNNNCLESSEIKVNI